MAALLTLLSVKQTHKFDVRPEWLNPVASSLLSKQMTRPGGILGILNVMLGRSEQGKYISPPLWECDFAHALTAPYSRCAI